MSYTQIQSSVVRETVRVVLLNKKEPISNKEPIPASSEPACETPIPDSIIYYQVDEFVREARSRAERIVSLYLVIELGSSIFCLVRL